MPNLVEHQLRVAAVASMLCDNIDDPSIDRDTIIKTCLLHDMGNIIKSNLEYFPDFIEVQNLDYWIKIKNDFIEKYGTDEHKATIAIIKELGLQDEIIRLADQNRFSLFCEHLEGPNLNIKIIHYADARTGPYGILSLQERMDEAKERYKDHYLKEDDNVREKLVGCAFGIEKQIFKKCNIKPEDINDESVAPYIEKLRNFEI